MINNLSNQLDACILNNILGFLAPSVKDYRKIRKIVFEAIMGAPYSPSVITIAYTSPQVERISDVRFILMGELHGGCPLETEIRMTNGLVMSHLQAPNSLCLVEWGLFTLVQGQEIGKQSHNQFIHRDMVERFKIPNQIERLFGWDHHGSSSKQIYIAYEKGRVQMMNTYLKENPNPVLQAECESAKKNLAHALVANEKVKHNYKNGDSPGNVTEMPLRTQAMLANLQEAAKQMKAQTLKGKVFLIAGLKHLVECKGDEGKQHMSLQPLHDFLATIPHVIIYPSVIDKHFTV